MKSNDSENPSSKRPDIGVEWKYINLEYLQEIAPDNHAFFAEIMTLFQSESSSFINTIQSHFERKDFFSLCKIAHAMKPLGSYVGANELTRLVGVLESTSRNADEGALLEVFTRITEMINSINKEITQYLN